MLKSILTSSMIIGANSCMSHSCVSILVKHLHSSVFKLILNSITGASTTLKNGRYSITTVAHKERLIKTSH